MIKKIFICLFLAVLFVSCKTVDLEPKNEVVEEKELDLSEIEQQNFETEIRIDQLMKENDLEPTFLVIQEPKVYEVSSLQEEQEELSGVAALKQNLEDITIIPQYKDGRLQGWIYKENAVYKIICQTYHSTMILFEPGEEMVETPYIFRT